MANQIDLNTAPWLRRAEAPSVSLPPAVVRVTLETCSGAPYTGHRLVSVFTRREWIRLDGTRAFVWVPDQVSSEVPAAGELTIDLPNRADLRDDVRFRVYARDGELLYESARAAAGLPDHIVLAVEPKQASISTSNDDPPFNQPARIATRTIGEAGPGLIDAGAASSTDGIGVATHAAARNSAPAVNPIAASSIAEQTLRALAGDPNRFSLTTVAAAAAASLSTYSALLDVLRGHRRVRPLLAQPGW